MLTDDAMPTSLCPPRYAHSEVKGEYSSEEEFRQRVGPCRSLNPIKAAPIGTQKMTCSMCGERFWFNNAYKEIVPLNNLACSVTCDEMQALEKQASVFPPTIRRTAEARQAAVRAKVDEASQLSQVMLATALPGLISQVVQRLQNKHEWEKSDIDLFKTLMSKGLDTRHNLQVINTAPSDDLRDMSDEDVKRLAYQTTLEDELFDEEESQE